MVEKKPTITLCTDVDKDVDKSSLYPQDVDIHMSYPHPEKRVDNFVDKIQWKAEDLHRMPRSLISMVTSPMSSKNSRKNRMFR